MSLNPPDVRRSNLTAANLIPLDETICADKQQNSPTFLEQMSTKICTAN